MAKKSRSAPFASKAQILAGGSKPYRTGTVEIDGAGESFQIRYTPLSYQEGKDLAKKARALKASQESGEESGEDYLDETVELIADHLVDEEGQPLVTVEELVDAPLDVILAITTAIIPGAGGNG